MAVCVHRLGHQVTAADASGARLAVSTPEHRVELYSWPAGTHQAQVLDAEHEAPIAGLDFSSTAAPAAAACGAAAPLRLVSASHDRNAYVWTESSTTSNGSSSASTQLRPELVITRLAKAALCCAWAPGSLKFALGASERAAAVCYLDAERELWAPRLIKKKHGSAVMAVAWHPSGALLATASTDGKLRLFNAVVPEVDGKLSPAALRGSRFGECLLEAALPGGWGLAAAFSPSGDCLAVASQGSQVTLLHGIDLQDPASLDVASVDAAGCLQHLALPGLLPLKCLAFLSDGVVAGGGFDCCPVLCTRQENGQWQFARSLQGIAPSCEAAAEPQASSLAARIKLFEQQAAAAAATTKGSSRGAARAGAAGAAAGGQPAEAAESSQQQGGRGTPHANCIISVMPLPSGADGSLRFLTASMEGCIAEWRVDPASL